MRQKSGGRATGPLISPVSGSSPFNSNNANLAHLNLNRSGDLLDSRNPPLSTRGDRPTLPTAQSEIFIRNGFQSQAQSRQQSPQPGLPASYPPPGSTSSPFSHTSMVIQTPQPRLLLNNNNNSNSDQPPDASEWVSAQRALSSHLQPSSRPNSGAFPRPNGDLTPSSTPPNYPPNGHGPLTPVQLRQRT